MDQGGVIAYLSKGDSLDIYGFEMTAQEDSAIYLSISSEFISAACLKGAFVAEGDNDPAIPGEVYVHAYSADKTSAYEFDIERFLGSSSIAINPEVKDSLKSAMISQNFKKFWGFLQVSGTNAQAPISPDIEAKRRDYLLKKAVIDIRQTAQGDAEAMARISAERFLTFLAQRDDKAVAALLHPGLFSKKGRTPSEWLSLREEFAYDITQSALALKVKSASLGEGSMENGFEVLLKNGERFHLQTEPLDAMVFVKSIRKK